MPGPVFPGRPRTIVAGRAGTLVCRPAAAYRRREDVTFMPVEGVPESVLGLVRRRDGATAGVREFARTLASRGVSLAGAQVVA
ncbi:hypothetical protein [Streptomyces indiaensis]|uniref:LysR substrate binding domain-containing protein n=1 Tax=Streptomyces indiaensis TaxID=284033 RepID=A0ABP6HDJ6_9ACTN|nr:hypothetical protein [Streptomyces indiaensis]MCF1647424.1 hypothetical protein [Streptomyces indiaensis]